MQAFGLDCARLRGDVPLAGSPARSSARIAAEDSEGRLWVVERLAPGRGGHRQGVALVLDGLSRAGLKQVPAYLPSERGGFVLRLLGHEWQVSPFIAGDPLPRPEYVSDAPRGASLARFLGRLARHGRDLPDVADASFSLPAYVTDLMRTVGRSRPGLPPLLTPTVERLGSLYEAWEGLPRVFAHGDYHPLNVIWGGPGVRAVIDWEFCGPRPHLYDAANLLGCVGFESPRALFSGLAPAFIRGLHDEAVLDGESGPWLFPLFLGLRFAWLAEWLRLRDAEMLEMELDYMRLLMANEENIRRAWGLARS